MRDLLCSIWMKDEKRRKSFKAKRKSLETSKKIYTFRTPKKSARRNILMNIKYCILYGEAQYTD